MTTDQTWRNRTRERAKLALRRVLHHYDLELSRAPYPTRLARALDSVGVTTVIDVGANVGQFAIQLRRAGFTGEIISIEPLSGAFKELSSRAARDPRWHVLRAAAGSEPGEIQINVAANSFSSSVLPMTSAHTDNAPGSEYIAAEHARVTTVQEVVESYSVDPSVTLLKVDTQGFEAEVLAGAGDLVRSFAAIQVEMSFVELYQGQRLFDESYAQMLGWGLHLYALETGFSGADGRLLQCDGLFVREV